MANNILAELEKAMKERNIKIPALAVKLGIPKDRIYKWYQEGTSPKTDDCTKIWKWVNGEKSSNSFNEEDAPYGKASDPNYLISIIKTQAEAILSQQTTINALADNFKKTG